MKTKLFTTIILLSVIGNATAQTPSWIWARSGGSVSNDYSNATCTDANGNVYITGTFQGSSIIFGNDTLHNTATATLAVFVAKYDANGNVLWARSGGGTDYDWVYGICTDANNNVFIEGYSESPSITFDTITLNNSSAQQVFLVKYDSIGNVQWGKIGKGGGANGYNYGWGICSDAAGNVYLYGNCNSNKIIFDNDTLGKGAFIVKYDGGGNVIWAKKIATGLITNSREQGMCADTYGNIYITGGFFYEGIFGNDTLTAVWLAAFLAKYDLSGNLAWVTSPGGESVGSAISADANGSVYMTGYFGSSVAFGNDTLAGLPFSASAIFTAKYDSSGNALWGRSPGGSGFDYGQSICTDANGNAVVTGYFNSSFLNFGGNPIINSFTGNYDGFIAAYDGNGNALWAKDVGAQGNEYGMGVCANALGDIYLTGYFESFSLNFDGNIVTNNGSADIFLAKLSAPTGINEYFSDNDIPLLLYPNPSSTGEFNISSFQFPIQNIEVFNSLGEKVYSETISKTSIRKINLKNISGGIYFVKVFDGEKYYCKKIIVELN